MLEQNNISISFLFSFYPSMVSNPNLSHKFLFKLINIFIIFVTYTHTHTNTKIFDNFNCVYNEL